MVAKNCARCGDITPDYRADYVEYPARDGFRTRARLCLDCQPAVAAFINGGTA